LHQIIKVVQEDAEVQYNVMDFLEQLIDVPVLNRAMSEDV
jgi:hypothetical protein